MQIDSIGQKSWSETDWSSVTNNRESMAIIKENVKRSVGSLQVCAGQEAGCGFTSGFRHKLTFIMRTIPDISIHLRRIDQIILREFIPSITGGIHVNDVERKLVSLPTKYGGLGIRIFEE